MKNSDRTTARLAVGLSVTAEQSTTPEDKALDDFLAGLSAFGKGKAINDYTATKEGSSLWKAYVSALGQDDSGAAQGLAAKPDQAFIARARDYGQEHGCKNDAEAFMAFGKTPEGSALYARFAKMTIPARRH